MTIALIIATCWVSGCMTIAAVGGLYEGYMNPKQESNYEWSFREKVVLCSFAFPVSLPWVIAFVFHEAGRECRRRDSAE